MMGEESEYYSVPLPARVANVPVQPVSHPWFVEVVEQARTGDRSAFDALYQGFYAPIRNYLARMVGDSEEGEDLAQETFLKAWHGLPNICDNLRFDSWLYRIATNTALDHLRKHKFRWQQLRQSDGLPEHIWISGPEERVAEKEHIQQALARVSLKYRSCMLLQLVANLTQREIAASQNISEKSVSIYVSRGCEQFRMAYLQLQRSLDKSSVKEGGSIREKLDPYALFRLVTEVSSQTAG